MSADTHKYGYAAKGTSVVLYRGPELRHYQYYTTTDWPGGLYFSPTFAGSRAGGLSAACWAAMVSIGEQGYLDAARRILETAKLIKQGIAEIPELFVLGDPLFCIAFGSKKADIYAVSDQMSKKDWNLNGLQHPAAVHLCVTLRHAQPGLAERFVEDLRESVSFVRANPSIKGSMAPVYGLTGNAALSGLVRSFLKELIDMLYKV
jgi:glutamate/tyrosine decarboxylase-like PLP-dependent enzyme